MDDEDVFDEGYLLREALNWREHVKNGEYWRINILADLPIKELYALQDVLQKIVPKKDYGDGVRGFTDNITPFFSENESDYHAASLLKNIRRDLHWAHGWYSGQTYDPFKKSVSYAIEILSVHNITYHGNDKTFIFWSKSRRRWVQFDTELRRKIFNKGQREVGYKFSYDGESPFDDSNSDLPLYENHDYKTRELPKRFIWLSKYPWRCETETLRKHFKEDNIELYSQLWHAVNILQHYTEFKRLFDEMVGAQREKQMGRRRIALNILAIADCSVKIGESFEAACMKKVEHETLTYRLEKQARTKASGQKSNQKKTQRILSFLEEIEQLGDMFPRMSEQSIVDQAFENVVGKHPGFWKQGKGQKDAYLSEHIRSEEPYKSRYYTIFGKTA